MAFTDIFIKRPVLAIVSSLILVLVGLLSYGQLSLREFPKIVVPVVSVSASYTGASAELMESDITSQIENGLSGIDGLDYVSSSSNPGSASINFHFKLGTDVDIAANAISNQLANLKNKLPIEVLTAVTKEDPDADPFMILGFSSRYLSPEALTDYLVRNIKPQVESLDGVASVRIFGDRSYAMRIALSPEKMASHQITLSDVKKAVTLNHIRVPTGQLKSSFTVMESDLNSDAQTPEAFNRLALKTFQGDFLRLNQVGHAQLGSVSDDFSATFLKQPAVYLGIVARSDANPLSVSEQARAVLSQFKQSLPKTMSLTVLRDNSEYIQRSIKEVNKTILEACLVVILVIFLALGSWRGLIIPTLAIPLSMIGVLTLMFYLGFSINTLTLLAMVLAVGLVVDDAIVVLENVHHHIQQGHTPMKAALIGAREIQFPVIAMTITLASVYAPIGFINTLSGMLFKEFALTLSGAVLISGWVALTLSPMLCSRLLKSHSDETVFERCLNQMTQRLCLAYQRGLDKLLQKRHWVIYGFLVVFLCIYGLFTHLDQELAPKEDIGVILTISSGPVQAGLAYTEHYTKNTLEPILESIPEHQLHGIINGIPSGPNSAMGFVLLKPWEKRTKTADQIAASLYPALSQITGLKTFAFNPYTLPGQSGGQDPVRFVVKTTLPYDQLSKIANRMIEKIKKNPYFVNVDVNLKFDQPTAEIHIDREKAALLGVTMADIGETLSMAISGAKLTTFSMQGRIYDVIPLLDSESRRNPEDLKRLYVRNIKGDFISLSNLIRIETQVTPQQLNHFQQLRSATITASLLPGYSLHKALAFMRQTAASTLEQGMQYDYSGKSRQFIESTHTLAFLFVSALLFIFLVLAAQFESFVDPLIVLFTVPLAMLGALMAMMLQGASLNIYTQIALVTLIGLISKHGILMVDFANQLQIQSGLTPRQAVIQAASRRLRPILMTTAAMALGSLPLALATGAGSISRSQMGFAIVGGLMVGTCFTLIVIPTMYTYLARRHSPA